jgi:hypothetical protein
VQALREEVEYMEPFTEDSMKVMFVQVEPIYASSLGVLRKAESKILGDNEVDFESDELLMLVKYHTNVLKIHRLLFTRQLEGTALLPPATPLLQKQVSRTYDALRQLSHVITTVAAAKNKKKSKPRRVRTATTRNLRSGSGSSELQMIPPLILPLRISPFITEGSSETSCVIDGATWPRYV